MNPLLHSKIVGDGKPLLILHGFLGMLDNWKTLGNQYAEQGFQVHLIDQRNHGKSFWSEDFNYDVLTKDLMDYILGHGLGKVCLLGHSMGGKTAMHFACEYPELAERLIVGDISPKYYPPHHQQIIKGLKSVDLNSIGSRSEAEAELQKHIKDFGTRQFLLKNLYWADKEKLAWRFNLEVLGEKMNEVGEALGPTAKYDGPALFLSGGRSGYLVPGDIPEILRHFPQAIFGTIENAGHWLHAEHPRDFFEKSLNFLVS